MTRAFGNDAITAVVRRDRRLTPRSANFWALIHQIPREDVAALREPVWVGHRHSHGRR